MTVMLHFLHLYQKKNDFIILEAIIDCIVVMSVCPMDIVPINGEDRIINEIHYQILIN